LGIVDFKLGGHVEQLADVQSFKLGEMHFEEDRGKGEMNMRDIE
jgi:hypothetical protein